VAWICRGWTEDSVVEDDVICVGLVEKVRIYQKVRIKNLTDFPVVLKTFGSKEFSSTTNNNKTQQPTFY
jgi:hypothetical protein